jgi:hypothetical protein
VLYVIPSWLSLLGIPYGERCYCLLTSEAACDWGYLVKTGQTLSQSARWDYSKQKIAVILRTTSWDQFHWQGIFFAAFTKPKRPVAPRPTASSIYSIALAALPSPVVRWISFGSRDRSAHEPLYLLDGGKYRNCDKKIWVIKKRIKIEEKPYFLY